MKHTLDIRDLGIIAGLAALQPPQEHVSSSSQCQISKMQRNLFACLSSSREGREWHQRRLNKRRDDRPTWNDEKTANIERRIGLASREGKLGLIIPWQILRSDRQQKTWVGTLCGYIGFSGKSGGKQCGDVVSLGSALAH